MHLHTVYALCSGQPHEYHITHFETLYNLSLKLHGETSQFTSHVEPTSVLTSVQSTTTSRLEEIKNRAKNHDYCQKKPQNNITRPY